jgi:hypothetical protein
MLQGGRHLGGEVPSNKERDRVLDRVYVDYPRTRCPEYFAGKKHTVTKEHVLAQMQFVNRKGSPGLPWAALAKTKGELMDRHAPLLVEAVLQKLTLLQEVDLTDPKWEDPEELVKAGLTGLVRLFAKNEPHKKAKLAEGRVRLISSVPIDDELVERLLCNRQNEAEIENWTECPSAPGIGLSQDEQSEKFYASVKPFLNNLAEGDVRGWDFDVKWWMLLWDVMARIKLCGAAPDSAFAKILHARMWCLARKVFSTSDGRLFKQMVAGIMASGSYLTSSTNSRMRVMLAYLFYALFAKAMGDDSLETFLENAREKYRTIGIDMKMFRRCENDEFEFCSHKFSDGKAIPLNWAKALFRLLSSQYDMTLLAQFCEDYRNSPEIERCVSIIAGSGWVPVKLGKQNDEEGEEETW